jgi:polyisoprenoid-binding protein YceI
MKGHDMTRLLLSTRLSVVTLLLITPAAFAADFYKIDPDHTSVIFGCAHAGLSYTYGMFRDVSGQYQIDEANPANCRFQLVIKTESLDTNNADRDTHLRSPDFFDAKQYPEITFDSTRCERVETQDHSAVYRLLGNLSIHGVTKPVQLNLRMLAKKPGATGTDMRTGFLCSVELKRTDFRMSNLLEDDKVGDAVAVTVSFEGAQQNQANTQPRK